MTIKEIEQTSREDKIAFLRRAQSEEPKYFNYDNYGDFSQVSDEELNLFVEKLYCISIIKGWKNFYE